MRRHIDASHIDFVTHIQDMEQKQMSFIIKSDPEIINYDLFIPLID